MAAFFAEYGLFLLKAITIVVAIAVIIVIAATAGRKAVHEGLEVENLNKKYRKIADTLRNAVLSKDERKKACLLYTSPSPRDQRGSRMPSSA